MASRRTTSGPTPWPQRESRTTFLRVPSRDWTAVKTGVKTEFRATGRAVTQLWNVQTPMPVVGYRDMRVGNDSRLLVLVDTWREPLGAISNESLEREGFDSLAHFRSYWVERTKRRFAPLERVQVYRVRPCLKEDLPDLAQSLLVKLYGPHLP
jgi:hypothetical protein